MTTEPSTTEPSTTEPSRRPMEPRDLFALRAVGSPAIHPHDDAVVFTSSWPDEHSDSNRSQLHVWTPDATRQLSYGHNDGAPVFSPDGSTLAFVRSTPSQPTELVLLDWMGRGTTVAATFTDGIDRVVWIDDRRLAVLAASRPADQRGVDDDELERRPRVVTRLDYRFNGRGWTHDRRIQPFIVERANTESGRPTPEPVALADLLGDRAGYDLAAEDHADVAVSPDGTEVAVTASSSTARIAGAGDVWIHAIDGSSSRRLTPPGGMWDRLVWHPDGSVVTFGSPDARRYGFARPYIVAEGADPTVLGPHDLNAGGAVAPPLAVDGGVLVEGPRRGRIGLDRYGLDGSLATRIDRDCHMIGFDARPDGSRLVAALSWPDRPAELWDMTEGDGVRLVGLNDALLAQLDLAEIEAVEIASSDGATVEAFIAKPPTTARSTGEPRPGLVYVHGGPMSQYGHYFFDEFQLAAAAGYVVIGGNPRGSDGYGEAWATAVVGDLGGGDWDDVTAITDHLVSLDGVDGRRIGIGGGSYGGFMTAWAISHSDRYRAALVERAVTSWTTMFGTSDIGPFFVDAILDATIEDDPRAVVRQSPLTYAATIDTPTLIVHSEQDWRCPIEQAEQLFAAIIRNGGDATLVRFPGENHELSRSGSPRHRVERVEIVHGFFDEHLLTVD